MKITDTEVIKNGERGLIAAVINNLDRDAVKRIIQERVTAQTLSSKGGRIVVHNNEIAFKLDFSVKINGSLMFDREGNYLPESAGETGDILQPVQEPVQQPAQQVVQEPVQKPVKQPVQEPVQQPVQEPVQQQVQQPIKEPVQKPVQRPIYQSVQQPLKKQPDNDIPDHVSDDEPDIELKLEDALDVNYDKKSRPAVNQEPEIELNLESDDAETENRLSDNVIIDDDDDISNLFEENLDFWETKK